MNVNKILILIIKTMLFCMFALSVHSTAKAQNKYQTDTFMVQKMLFKHPFKEVIKHLNNPDTLLICHYPLRYGENEGNPISITLYVYKENGSWKSASLFEYYKFKNKSRTSWKQKRFGELTEPKWLQSGFKIDEKMKELKSELRSNIAKEDISTIHTYGFVKYGDDITTFWIIGNLRDDLYTKYPTLSYIFTVGFFEAYNQHIVKKIIWK